MKCTYYYKHGFDGLFEFSYDDLFNVFYKKLTNESKASVSDVIFSKSKRDKVWDSLWEMKKQNHFETKVGNHLDGEPTYGKLSPQTMIDDHRYVIRGSRPVVQLRPEEHAEVMIDSFMTEDHLTKEAAELKVATLLKNWNITAEDAKLLHQLINSFNFFGRHSEDGPEFGSKLDWNDHCRGTKFENVSNKIYDRIIGQNTFGSVASILRTRHKLGESCKIISGLGLKAYSDVFDEDIIGHIDHLVIDTHGNLHIYNYKMSATPISEWSSTKLEKYRHQMALLKQMLANNGYDVTNATVHIIPIRVDYNDDLSQINDLQILSDSSIDLTTDKNGNYIFDKYDSAAKYFIKSNVVIDEMSSDVIDRINKSLLYFLPERNVNYQGIHKTAEEWIKSNYGDKYQHKIKKVPGGYLVYLSDNAEDDGIFIDDETHPYKNEKLKLFVETHISDLNDNNTILLNLIMLLIESSKSSGFMNFTSESGNLSMGWKAQFFSEVLSKYFQTYIVGDKEKPLWKLIPHDTLAAANIMLFQNVQSGLIDVVTLSAYNLRSQISFNRLKNIMGHYINDASQNTKSLINYSANFSNIEALRTMVVLNEVLPDFANLSLLLGLLKIVSTSNDGMVEIMDFETLNKEMFQHAVRVVKSCEPEFLYTNNFSKIKYSDPTTNIINTFESIISSESRLSESEKKELSDIGFLNLDSIATREAKITHLQAVIKSLLDRHGGMLKRSPKEIVELATGRRSSTDNVRACANLLIQCELALSHYSGQPVANEYAISSMSEYIFTLNRVPNRTFRGVESLFRKAINEISFIVREEYNPIQDATLKFFEEMGYSSLLDAFIGNKTKLFDNLYKRNDKGEIITELRNPYVEDDGFTKLSKPERDYLKVVLFELNKTRAKIHGLQFNFTSKDDPRLAKFAELNTWFFNLPLQKSSDSSILQRGIKAKLKDWKRKASNLFDKGRLKQAYEEAATGMVLDLQLKQRNDDVRQLQMSCYAAIGDGIGSGKHRTEMLAQHDLDFWETNLADVMANYIESYVKSRELNKALLTTKGVLMELELLGDLLGEGKRDGIDLTIKMIEDYVKSNVFNESLMEPQSLKLLAWLYPFKKLVSSAYIAGNVISMFRDTFEGLWQNMMRTVNHFLTDIDGKSLGKAYKEVVLNAFTDPMSITTIDQLCKIYRLSNLDMSRITESMKSGRGGLFNVDRWAYATLRAPDFLNRMVLFVAHCVKDGCWEAFSILDGKLVYNWKLDKRYEAFAKGDTSDPRYYEHRTAYYNAVRAYNKENPGKTIDFSGEGENALPVAYSNLQIEEIKNVSNSIYGAYDKSMRAKYENVALGWAFGTFSTWMNGIVNNYLTKPGLYYDSNLVPELETDGSGNLRFLDIKGNAVIKIDSPDGEQYVYEVSQQPYEGEESDLSPSIEYTPDVCLGIIYTFKHTFDSFVSPDGGFDKFKKEVWANPNERKNLSKALSDALAAMLFFALFKLAIDKGYNEFKKSGLDNSFVTNAMAELLYKSSSRSYDGFLGLFNVLDYVGENTNPPMYKLPIKLVLDGAKFCFGDKTAMDLLTGNVAIFKSFQDAYKAEMKKG